ncbi:MAG: NADH-quinone oxidoreductase subunit J [Calditrichaeota bacterium]|nr:MAG: NADH-quinone oxidoreductase subunit J [Calditrichota bacterium]
MNLDTIIFIVSALVAVSGATMMISLRNPVLSVMSMILSLVAQAVLYIQLGALFVGAVLIIVYSGAIMVLFLFVIMLLNLRGSEDLGRQSSPIKMSTKILFSLMLFVEFVFVIKVGFFKGDIPLGVMSQTTDNFGSVESVAELLFTNYLYPFELTSVLLLSAIVGAVVMSKRDAAETKTDESAVAVKDSDSKEQVVES